MIAILAGIVVVVAWLGEPWAMVLGVALGLLGVLFEYAAMMEDE